SMIQMEFPNELFGERTARAFGEDCNLRADVHTGFIVPLRLAGFVDPFVAGAYSYDSIAIHQQIRARKTREDIDAALLDFLAKPSNEATEGNDDVAVVLQRRRGDRE